MVVEDEPDLADVISDYLQRRGFDVEISRDGAAAVAAARVQAPDVVVLDLGLPSVDGVEVCRRLRTFSDAYVVMVTARADEVDTLVGLSAGADDYLTKPFSPRELIARIEAMLRRPRRVVAEPEQTPLSAERRIGGLSPPASSGACGHAARTARRSTAEGSGSRDRDRAPHAGHCGAAHRHAT